MSLQAFSRYVNCSSWLSLLLHYYFLGSCWAVWQPDGGEYRGDGEGEPARGPGVRGSQTRAHADILTRQWPGWQLMTTGNRQPEISWCMDRVKVDFITAFREFILHFVYLQYFNWAKIWFPLQLNCIHLNNDFFLLF